MAERKNKARFYVFKFDTIPYYFSKIIKVGPYTGLKNSDFPEFMTYKDLEDTDYAKSFETLKDAKEFASSEYKRFIESEAQQQKRKRGRIKITNAKR